MKANRRGGRSCALAIALLVGGCGIMPPERTPVTLYELPAGSLAPSAPQTVAPIDTLLRLATPEASGLLDGARIVVMPRPHQPQTYRGARWADALPRLIRDRLLDAFHDDGRIPRLIHDDGALSADVALHSDLRTFRSEYRDDVPEAIVRLDVRLIEVRSQRLLASHRFVQRQRASSEAIDDVVGAFGLAMDRLSRELVDWTATALDKR
ncbi:hypothetical protein F0A17_04115 [Billgrantia pellis]|uniref:ABC-type transport auxiliary lipoprotein component domain-containing protein n=2 Tax=Billgrantia pellis TaxID=2606936 RepID=A0A7V7G1E4_9GAMM|nr:hypothetical protein F0A17_04115 [Halomonas pellis]